MTGFLDSVDCTSPKTRRGAEELAAATASARSLASPRPPWPGTESRVEGVNGTVPLELLCPGDTAALAEPEFPPNGTCGLVLIWREGPNGSAPLGEAVQMCEPRAPLQRLDALVSGGVMLTHCAREEFSSVLESANRAERYFAGGMSAAAGRTQPKDSGRAPGERFLEAVAQFLAAFRTAWEEVQRNEQRWAPYVGGPLSKLGS